MKIKCLAVPPYGTNCYVVEDGGQAAVIDPGGSASYLIEELKKLGTQVQYLLLTHGHYDHTGAVPELLRAMAADDPAGEDAREAVRLHAAWLARFWPPESVTPQAHVGMAELYVQDRRFTDYYEKTAPGFAAFFLRAARAYYQN